jgi:HEAT repeat protein
LESPNERVALQKERVDQLIRELRHKDWRRRIDAAWELGQIGDAEAVAPLCAALRDWSPWDDAHGAVRIAVADALVSIGTPSVLPLCEVLNTGSPGAREWAVEALGRIGDTRAVLPLREALCDRRAWDGRPKAAEALGKIGAPAVLPLCEALGDVSSDVRARAAETLGRLRDRRAVPSLCAALRDEEWWASCSAAIALGQIGDPEAVVPLCEALRYGSRELRHYAVQALGQIGDARAVLPLIEACKESNAAAWAMILEVIDRIVLHEPAAAELVRLGAPAVPPLCELLRAGRVRGRCQAARMLARIAEREALPDLRMAVPLLNGLLSRWPVWSSGEEECYRAALERIEAAIAALDLPLPAAAPPPSPETLPIPAALPPPDADRLPIPARGPASSPEAPAALASLLEGAVRLLDAVRKTWVRWHSP